MSSPIVHIDIHSGAGTAEADQHRFYAELFGWPVDVKGPGYALLRTPDGGPDGALIEAETPGISLGVAVADLDAAIERAVALGGTVLMPPTDNGWVVKAQITDPAGNPLTLIKQLSP